MYKQLFLTLLGVFALVLIPFHAINAQEQPADDTIVTEERVQLEAIAGEDKNALVNRQLLFSGELSTRPEQGVLFRWEFGDGTWANGVEVSHKYQRDGVYRVTLTIQDSTGRIDRDDIIVTVARDIIVLISDDSVASEALAALERSAVSQGILIVHIKSTTSGPDYIIESQLAKLIRDAETDLLNAKTVIDWTESQVGINALLEAFQSSATIDGREDITRFNKTLIISINDSNLAASYRIAQHVYSILNPASIILTNSSALDVVTSSVDQSQIITNLQENEIEYQLIGIHSTRDIEKLGAFNFMSVLLNYMVNKGVPINTLYMLLILPFIATVIAVGRQVIGIKSFGIYTPSIITLAFLAVGLKYGLILFFLIVVIGTLIRHLAKRLRLMYVPRMALLLIIMSFAILGTYWFGLSIGQHLNVASIPILPILILILLGENFIAAQMEYGYKEATKLTLETLFLSILAYYLVTWPSFKNLLLGFPETVLLTVAINLLLGRWKGLRLLEYIRFKDLIREDYDVEE